MTCIVGLVKEGKVYIGGDSAAVTADKVEISDNPKVFYRENMIFGYTCSFRAGQVLQYNLEIPKRESGLGTMEYLLKQFIPALRDCAKENGISYKNNEQESWFGEFLLGYKDRLFKVCSDYQILENECGFNSCGSGERFALGALSILTSTKTGYGESPSDILRTALSVSEQWCSGVQGPFTILSND